MGCKKDGGDPTCTIRSCASKKDITNCGQCDGLAECKSFESMEQGNPKIKEELRKIKNVDQKDVIEKWLSELKTKWPHCTPALQLRINLNMLVPVHMEPNRSKQTTPRRTA